MSYGPPKKRARARATEPGVAPTEATLHEAALAYLAKSAASSAMVARVLERRAATWARRAGRAGQDPAAVEASLARCREAIARIVARFGEVGLVNDAAFATARAERMARSGRSRRAISAHLASKGIASETAREAVATDAGTELTAALTFARKRRIGPFARGGDADEAPDEEPETRPTRGAMRGRPDEAAKAKQRALGAMARAGFDWGVCERVFRMSREEADERLGGAPAGLGFG